MNDAFGRDFAYGGIIIFDTVLQKSDGIGILAQCKVVTGVGPHTVVWVSCKFTQTGNETSRYARPFQPLKQGTDSKKPKGSESIENNNLARTSYKIRFQSTLTILVVLVDRISVISE